jgi:hypothetical protein
VKTTARSRKAEEGRGGQNRRETPAAGDEIEVDGDA